MSGSRRSGWQDYEASRQREVAMRGTIAAHQKINPSLLDRSSKDFGEVAAEYRQLIASGFEDGLAAELAAVEMWAARRPRVRQLPQPRPDSFRDANGAEDDPPAPAPKSQLSGPQQTFLEERVAKGQVTAQQAERIATGYRR